MNLEEPREDKVPGPMEGESEKEYQARIIQLLKEKQESFQKGVIQK